MAPEPTCPWKKRKTRRAGRVRALGVGLAAAVAALLAGPSLPTLASAAGTPTGNELIVTPVNVGIGVLLAAQAWTPPVDSNANPINGIAADTITGIGYDPAGTVFGMVCDGNPPTATGWTPVSDCDPLTTSPAIGTGTNGNPTGQFTFGGSEGDQIDVFRGLSPNDQFNCLAPADNPNGIAVDVPNLPAGGEAASIDPTVPSWGANTVGAAGGGTTPCTVRISYSLTSLSTASDKFFPLALPQDATVSNITVPSPPTAVIASPGNGSVIVSWDPPANTGNAAITKYTATAAGVTAASCTTTGALNCTITGLTNGTSYTVTVTATNAAGTSVPSTPSNEATPFGPPGAPTAVNAVAGVGSATISWTAPASDGGSPVTGYAVTASPGGETCLTDGATTCVVTGLIKTAYTFTVQAGNPAGFGPSSTPSAAVTPKGNRGRRGHP